MRMIMKSERGTLVVSTSTLSAFQGQLLFTLPAAILSRRFLLSSVFVLQDAGSESLAESQKEFETFFQFERVPVLAEKVGQFHPHRVQLLKKHTNLNIQNAPVYTRNVSDSDIKSEIEKLNNNNKKFHSRAVLLGGRPLRFWPSEETRPSGS